MTTQTEFAALFSIGAPPQAGGVVGVLRWCDRLFSFLSGFLRQPEFAGVVLTRVDFALPTDFKARNGMLMYGGPGVFGANEGLYVYEAGAWKKVTTA